MKIKISSDNLILTVKDEELVVTVNNESTASTPLAGAITSDTPLVKDQDTVLDLDEIFYEVFGKLLVLLDMRLPTLEDREYVYAELIFAMLIDGFEDMASRKFCQKLITEIRELKKDCLP